MKKILALVLAMILSLCCIAFAEEVDSIEDLYAGTWVNFEDDGFAMYLPSDWLEVEVTEEMLSSGIYYAMASPDGHYTFSIAWSALEADMSVEELLASLQTEYAEAEIVDFETYSAVLFADAENGVLAFAALDAVDQGMYMFNFTPVDEEAAVVATLLMTSLTPIEAAA